MQWIKGKVSGSGESGREGGDKQNFMIGSHKWTGSSQKNDSYSNGNAVGPLSPTRGATPMAPVGSFRNPESAQNAVQAYDAQQQQPNPYVQHSSSHRDMSSSRKGDGYQSSGAYPKVYESSEQRGNGQEEGVMEEEILTGSQVLVTIPGAIVHLIDEDESVHLATGDFSLVRFFQEGTKVVVIAKVGPDLQWPLVQEEPTVKLDPTHYFFTLRIPGEDNDSPSSKKGRNGDGNGAVEVLNYGLTFAAASANEQHLENVRELDYFLERYSMFSAPTIVRGDASEESIQAEDEQLAPHDPNFLGKMVSEETVSGEGKVVQSEDTSKAFWTTVAPNVDDYNHKMSKGIAVGAGHLIRGIFWLSDSTVSKLDSGHAYMTNKFKPKDKKSKVSAVTLGGVRSARRLSGMTDKVAAGVLGGILYTTGLVSSAVINSPPGKTFFRFLPGEVALVSLDSFGRVFDAVELAGKDVMTRSSSVTQEFVNYRYGEQAKELTDESLRTVGHVAATAWTLTKIRKALNPTKLKVSKTGIAKSLAKSAAGMNKKT